MKKNNQNVTEKWWEMLAHFTKVNINAVYSKCLISFCLALPGSNAQILNSKCVTVRWKNRLKTETVEALTIVKTYFKDFSCSEFFSQILKEKAFPEQIHKSDKYSAISFSQQQLTITETQQSSN
jgi:hypothetical protein